MINLKITCACLAAVLSVGLVSCGKKTGDGYVESGELVVVEDTSDITLGAYDVDTLNPIATASKSVQRIMNIVYEPLFSIDEGYFPEPVLASSYTLSEDGTGITVILKDGVKWHDGTNFTADDVVYTLSRMRSSEGLYKKLAEKISSFTATGKNEVVINFSSPETNPAYLLTFPVMQKNSGNSVGADFVPVGTGSYKFASKNSGEIFLEPSTIWHGGEAGGKKIVIEILKDSLSAAEAFNVGELDAITSDEVSLESVTPKGNSYTETIISNRMVFIGFNTANLVLTPNVRHAVNGFLDKEKILEQDAYGHGMVAELPINPSSKVYKGIDFKKHSPDYAESLLTQEGYVLTDGVYQRDGYALSLRLLVNEENSQRSALADSIAQTLKAAGVEILVDRVGYQAYLDKIANDDFDLFIGEIDLEDNLNPGAMLSFDNYFNYDAAALNEALDAIYGVAKPDIYTERVAEFARRFHENPPYLPLYFRSESVSYGSYVSGTVRPVDFDPYKNIEKWYFYDKDGSEKAVGGEKTDE